MATEFTTMDISWPDVGDDGPEYATTQIEAIEVIVEHTHREGDGNPITPAAMDINENLDVKEHALVNVGGVQLANRGENLSGAINAGMFYMNGSNVRIVDGDGTDVSLISNGALDVSALGAITGDYSTSEAEVSFSDATG